MICPVCHGRQVLEIAGKVQPCGECGSMGTIHCCEGLIAQPEPSEVPCESVRPEGKVPNRITEAVLRTTKR